MAALPSATAEEVSQLLPHVDRIPDFPRPGLTYLDICSLLLEPKAFQTCINLLARRYAGQGITKILSAEARGFMLGAPLAYAMGVAFVPIRKKHKLPGEALAVDVQHGAFSKERLEMHKNAITEGDRVLIVDDVVGSGNSLLAVAKLVELSKAVLVESCCVAELPGLKGRATVAAAGLSLYTILPEETGAEEGGAVAAAASGGTAAAEGASSAEGK